VSQITTGPQDLSGGDQAAAGSDVKLPSDSTAKITSDSLLGGVHVAIAPGAALDDLKPGGEIDNTQGAVDLFGLIGQVIRPQARTRAAAPPAPAAGESRHRRPLRVSY
jgi:phospholipid/cholesterol/gamma-HCH transport system substrate-binding protein